MFVIVLARRKPHKLEVCEVLLRRGLFNENDNEILKDIYMKTLIGYEGECFADKYWQDLRLNIPHALLHNYETTHRDIFHHQMDTVFVCDRFLLIAELKYISGELSYNAELNQFWRNQNGQLLPLGDPFAQLSRHELLMSHYLFDIGVYLPIITAVIVTAKSAFLHEMPHDFHIFKIEGLGLKLKSWLERFPTVLSEEEVISLANQLSKRLSEKRWNWQKVFPDLSVKQGVLCSCKNTMTYYNGKFVCKCGKKLKYAMYEALNDYRILHKEWISNNELREYLGINSPNTANKILKKVSDAHVGQNRGRKYLLSKEKLELRVKKLRRNCDKYG